MFKSNLRTLFLNRNRFTPPLLYSYVIRELLTPFLAILFVFTGLLFLAKSLKLVELIVKKTASLLDIASLFSLIVPQFLEMAFPMACLLSIIVGFGRLSADSELVVMRSVGLSLKRLLYPVSGFIIGISIVALLISTIIRPWASYQLNLGLFRLATQQASSGLVAGAFNSVGPLTIYAREVLNNGDLLKDVIIGDQRNPESQKLFFAKDAKFKSYEGSRTVTIDLFDGSMQEGTGTNISQTYYSSNSITLTEEELSGSSDAVQRKKTSEMSTAELIKNMGEVKASLRAKPDEKLAFHLSRVRVELQKRFVLPLSCMAVGLLAFALGIQPSRGASKWALSLSFIIGILLIVSYYMLFALVSALSENIGQYIEILMWLPNLFFLIVGIILYKKVSSEQWISVISQIEVLLSILQRKFSKKVEKS